MPLLSLVIAVSRPTRHLHELIAAAGPARNGTAVEVLLVSDGPSADLDDRARSRSAAVRTLHPSPAAGTSGRAAAFDAGLAAAGGDWIAFLDADRLPTARELRRLRHMLRRCDTASPPALVCLYADASPAKRNAGVLHAPIDTLARAPSARTACLPRRPLQAAGIRFNGDARADFVATDLLLRHLLHAGGDATITWAAGSAAPACGDGPDAAAWALPDTYGRALACGHLELLNEAARRRGHAPRWLQRTLLLDLQTYFATDRRARAPTAVVTEPVAAGFHEVMHRIVDRIDADIVERPDPARADRELREALLGYQRRDGRSDVVVTDFDGAQRLLRISWYFRGVPAEEAFLIDGESVAPAHAKRRNCRYFRRTLCHERIVWLPVDPDARLIEVRLDGAAVALAIGTEPPAIEPARPGALPLDAVRKALARPRVAPPPTTGGLRGLKARLLCRLAALAAVRRRYARAWVFIDRAAEADDNAEHLYRWTVRNRPEINAWFLLDPQSPDWPRLHGEGFRLVPPGLARRLLLLNCEHLISSQPAYATGGFDPDLYAGALRWRFSFLQHGVIKDDMSHWLSGQPFALFVTTSPAEHASIVADDTPYTYTERETRRTGLPRHDRLLELSRTLPPEAVGIILLMPTWRGRLVAEGSAPGVDPVQFRAAFRASEYASSWRALLGSDALRRLAERHGKRLVFMPHPDSALYLDAFEAPPHVEIVTKATTPIQPLFCRSAAMVTDFSSVAFEMAYLRRPVVYFQFDRDRFFAGDHNWREGYFSYERDGFGPVAMTPDEVVEGLDAVLAAEAPALAGYLARMERAVPERDGGSCRRVFEAVQGLNSPGGIADLVHRQGDAMARGQ